MLESPGLTLQAQKANKTSMSGKTITSTSNTRVILPDTFASELSSSVDDDITLSLAVFKDDPFLWSPSSEKIASQVVSFELKDSDGNHIAVEDLKKGIEISIASDKSAPECK